MKVIIPVAGKGTRMRPFTHTQPKSLLPVAGKPVIDHILEKILPLQPTEIVFVTGHLKRRFEEEVRRAYPHLPCTFVEQREQRGTADAIWSARHAFTEDVLIVFSDTIFDFPLTAALDRTDDGVFWAVRVPDPSHYGVLVPDASGHLTRIVEKPKEFITDLVNIGLYYVKDTALLSKGIEHAYAIAKEGDEVWLTSAFQYMIDHGARIGVEPVAGWYDTGTTAQTLRSNKELLEKYPGHAPRIPGVTIIPPVAIDGSAMLENCTIGPHVSIAARAHVKDSTISNSILDRGAVVHDATLTDSIVGMEAHVHGTVAKVFLGDHSRIE
jgi:glucose-1-phosphate thymidylyltransferase